MHAVLSPRWINLISPVASTQFQSPHLSRPDDFGSSVISGDMCQLLRHARHQGPSLRPRAKHT